MKSSFEVHKCPALTCRCAVEPPPQPEGKVCTTCDELKEFTEFHKDKHNSSGYTSQCKACRDAVALETRCLFFPMIHAKRGRKKMQEGLAVHGKKNCSVCGNTKPISEFYRDRCASTGFRPNCTKCYLETIRRGRGVCTK